MLVTVLQAAHALQQYVVRNYCSFCGALLLNAFEHLALSVYCFLSYCLLTPLMSPKDKTC